MAAIKNGDILKSARVEIVAAMYTRMLQHNSYPSPYEYKVACQRLVHKYRTLEDKIGNGIVSEDSTYIISYMYFHWYI